MLSFGCLISLVWRGTNSRLPELPLQAGSLLCPVLGLWEDGQKLCWISAEGLMGKRDIGCHKLPKALSEAVTGARQSAASLSPCSLPLGSALLVYFLVRKVWEGLKGKGRFYFHHLFVSFRQTETQVLPEPVVWFGCIFGKLLDVVWFSRAWGGSWRPGCHSLPWHWFGVASSKFLHNPRPLFLLFCQPCLISNLLGAETCLCVSTVEL